MLHRWRQRLDHDGRRRYADRDVEIDARPGDLRAAIGQALAVDGPAIVDCVVASNEIPNFPHLELDKIVNYAVAKIKEAMLAFCGR